MTRNNRLFRRLFYFPSPAPGRIRRGTEKCAVLLLLAALAGCQAEPFVRPALPLLGPSDPRAMADRFAAGLADRFISDDTLILQAPFHDDWVILSVLRVDRPAGTFVLYGFNPLGVELFRIRSDAKATTLDSVLLPLRAERSVLLAIAADVRRIYFNLAPDRAAQIQKLRRRVRFSQEQPGGRLIYEFGGRPAELLQKRRPGWLGDQWCVHYYQYTKAGKWTYPRGVVLDDGETHLRLIVKNRDWQVPPRAGRSAVPAVKSAPAAAPVGPAG
jgi:hypothetical protein